MTSTLIVSAQLQTDVDRLVQLVPTDLPAATKGFNELCLSPQRSATDRCYALIRYITASYLEGKDTLMRICDMISHVTGDNRAALIDILMMFAHSSDAPGFDRVYAATCLYNRCYFEEAFRSYERIAEDIAMDVKYRVEACRFLVVSEQEARRAIAQTCLIHIVEQPTLPTQFRYEIIAGFVSGTGIATILNSKQIQIPKDSSFAYGLLVIFFHNLIEIVDANRKTAVGRTGLLIDIRHMILSGQAILDISQEALRLSAKDPEGTAERQTKLKVITGLLAVASDRELPQDVRADAADVVHRFGTDNEGYAEACSQASVIIRELGEIAKPKSFMDAMKTLYTNAENIHDDQLAETALKFIENMVTMRYPVKDYAQVYFEIRQLIQEKTNAVTTPFVARVRRDVAVVGEAVDDEEVLNAIRSKLFASLNRINLDTSTYSSKKATFSQIVCNVWYRIEQCRGGPTYETLKERFLDELLEMNGSCGTGHSTRLINTLTGFDDTIKVGWSTQITSNLVGRLNARIRVSADVDALSVGMLPTASDAERATYVAFVAAETVRIRDEMYKEFVTKGYISRPDFDRMWADAVKTVAPLDE